MSNSNQHITSLFLNSLSPRAEEVVQFAFQYGVGEAIAQIYQAAIRHNLTFTPYQNTDQLEPTLGITPRQNHSLYLFRVRMKPDKGRIWMYLHADAFGTLEVTESEVAQAFGGKGWLGWEPGGIMDFVRRFDELFDLVEARTGKQLNFFDATFPDDESDDEFPMFVPQPSEPAQPSFPFFEGKAYEVTLTRYERNPEARAACIRYYGLNCIVCGFDFGQVYGEIGNGYIQVHHLTSLAAYGGEHEVDPIKDLRPVCPNCHVMLHTRTPPYTIEEMQDRLRGL